MCFEVGDWIKNFSRVPKWSEICTPPCQFWRNDRHQLANYTWTLQTHAKSTRPDVMQDWTWEVYLPISYIQCTQAWQSILTSTNLLKDPSTGLEINDFMFLQKLFLSWKFIQHILINLIWKVYCIFHLIIFVKYIYSAVPNNMGVWIRGVPRKNCQNLIIGEGRNK